MIGTAFFRRLLGRLALASVAGGAAVALTCGAEWARAEDACTKLSDVEVVHLLNVWKAEFTGGDSERLSGLYADAATVIATKEGEPLNGKEAIRSYFKDLLAKRPLVSIRPSSMSSDCGKAVVSGPVVYRLSGERKGTRMLLGGTYTAEYALKDGKWWIVRHQLAADQRAGGNANGDGAGKTSPPL
ncbi:nuclear transport factor 2 family protein [Hyphomicrobium sp.]|uniref:nuclear transport factor 2 family protein n=1 Tax=Hyphomicrobium sp. TaxID=82 RepID=UPI002D76B928|nr:nuclear transport factor 2 family protein [Hyphomicrobium sp.]HET6390256.1 nuclear transport factor 2 family protein [Hyphomicrobium sp.]